MRERKRGKKNSPTKEVTRSSFEKKPPKGGTPARENRHIKKTPTSPFSQLFAKEGVNEAVCSFMVSRNKNRAQL